ncbi:MAG: class I SAM-dependent methyltransferase [Acidimicrobiales bacterium]
MTNPWLTGSGARGDAYDRRFADLAASGVDVHGEVALLERLGVGSVLDAGCGTGRVAIELARRGHDVAGVDLDPVMLATARKHAPQVPWLEADLAEFRLDRSFDAIVMAGNVMIFVAPGQEAAVVANVSLHLAPGGLLVAGFSLRPGGLDVATYDACAGEAGLALEHRFATWDGEEFRGGDYAVSVHRRAR